TLPPYDVLDPIIDGAIEESLTEEEMIARGHDADTVRRVFRMIRQNEYKRQQAPPGLKVTGRAFGVGRRYPIASRARPG
ncbi:MAG: NAD+ synthase, partial [Myxococcota bacterium]